MKIFKVILFLFIGLLLANFETVTASNKIPKNFCISKSELKLYNLINKYRKEHNLNEIPLSKSLCYVSKMHVNDLQSNFVFSDNCNMHSWSDSDKWTPCCYTNDMKSQLCMMNKPAELTNYDGFGFEITFYSSAEFQYKDVFNTWISTQASNSVIINSGKWVDKDWKAVGVAISQNYAVVWFGEEIDVEKKLKVCNSDNFIVNSKYKDRKEAAKSNVSKRYYLIFGSYTNLKDSQKDLKKYKARGFHKAKIIQQKNRYRLSLSDFPSLSKSKKAKQKLGPKYKDIWILAK